MSEPSRKTFSNKFVRSLHVGKVGSAPIGELKQFAHSNTSKLAGVFSIVIAVLVVLVWQAIASPSRHQASTSNSPNVSNGSGLNSNLSSQNAITSDNSPVNVDVQKSGGESPSVNVNGQAVSIPQNGSVHKIIKSPNGNTTINVSIDGSASNANDQNISVFTHTSSHVNNFSSVDVSSDSN